MQKQYLFSLIRISGYNSKTMILRFFRHKLVTLFLAMAVLGGGSNLVADSSLTLSRNGSSKYSIVQDRNSASPTENNAAGELAEYLHKITGVKFPVVTPDKAASAVGGKIIVGQNKLSRKFLGDKAVEKLSDEEFVIRSGGNGDIYIVGGSPVGTLYGVYHFLDNVLGVRWVAPDAEFVPAEATLSIPALDVREKPAYVRRRGEYFVHTDPESDYKWFIHNRFNGTIYNLIRIQKILNTPRVVKIWSLKNEVKLPYEKYGVKNTYAPPFFVHTLALLIPTEKYFEAHPDWWEEIKGKRVNRGRSSAMCLTNQGLIDETAKNAIAQIDKYPDSKIISISENDRIAGYCSCPRCRDFMAKHGNAESALLLNFVNRVAEKIHQKYPDIMVETLAYIKTERPPENMKAGKNIQIRLCAWGASHGVPYSDVRNTKGLKLLRTVKKWKKICPNIGIWDYVTTYKLNFTPNPNLHTIIPNLKSFYDAGVNDYFFEADHNQGGYRSGESLARAFLLSRGLWNPNADTDKLLKDFTDAYYGKAAGKYVREYWKLLYDSNRKANYIGLYQNGNLGKAPYLQLKVILKADGLLGKATQAAESEQYREHVQKLRMQVNHVMLYNYREYEAEAKAQNLKMPVPFKTLLAEFSTDTEKYGALRINRKDREGALRSLAKYYYQDFSVSASKSYGSKPEAVFDEDLRTLWNGGDFSGWIEIKFAKPKVISSIYTVFSQSDVKAEYTILGSLDGRTWQTLVPRKATTSTKIIQEINPRHPVLFADDKIKPTKVLYVKTKIFNLAMQNGKRNWIVIQEQSIR